jgi:hypothetical protein
MVRPCSYAPAVIGATLPREASTNPAVTQRRSVACRASSTAGLKTPHYDCLGDQRHPVGPIMAAAGEHARPITFAEAEEPETTLLDLLGPLRPAGDEAARARRMSKMVTVRNELIVQSQT